MTQDLQHYQPNTLYAESWKIKAFEQCFNVILSEFQVPHPKRHLLRKLSPVKQAEMVELEKSQFHNEYGSLEVISLSSFDAVKKGRVVMSESSQTKKLPILMMTKSSRSSIVQTHSYALKLVIKMINQDAIATKVNLLPTIKQINQD